MSLRLTGKRLFLNILPKRSSGLNLSNIMPYKRHFKFMNDQLFSKKKSDSKLRLVLL